jgi:hypothetical protein
MEIRPEIDHAIADLEKAQGGVPGTLKTVLRPRVGRFALTRLAFRPDLFSLEVVLS